MNPATLWLPILFIRIWSQVKTRQSQSYRFKKQVPKNYNFGILQTNLHATHFLMLDKMYKYKMDPVSIVKDTERTRSPPLTDRRTDGRTRWNQYTPFQLLWILTPILFCNGVSLTEPLKTEIIMMPTSSSLVAPYGATRNDEVGIMTTGCLTQQSKPHNLFQM